jgi:hypothetical protein
MAQNNLSVNNPLAFRANAPGQLMENEITILPHSGTGIV